MRGLHKESHLVERIGWLRAAVLGANDGIISTASALSDKGKDNVGGKLKTIPAERVVLERASASSIRATTASAVRNQ